MQVAVPQGQARRGQARAGWLDRVMQEAGHTVFRIVSIVFSLASAHAIYWFFSALNGVDGLQQYVTITISLGFVALGYFVTRGLAHRMMEKQSIWSYLLIGLLYVFVEVVCNFGEAAARGPDIQWVHDLSGWQFEAFSFLVPVVLSIIPLFNLALACIDVDLMREKNKNAVKEAPSMTTTSYQAAQTAYPTMQSPTQGSKGTQAPRTSSKQNAGWNLANFWNNKQQAQQQQQQGQPTMVLNGNGTPTH